MGCTFVSLRSACSLPGDTLSSRMCGTWLCTQPSRSHYHQTVWHAPLSATALCAWYSPLPRDWMPTLAAPSDRPTARRVLAGI